MTTEQKAALRFLNDCIDAEHVSYYGDNEAEKATASDFVIEAYFRCRDLGMRNLPRISLALRG